MKLASLAADKIRNYREPYARNRSLAFLPACMSTSGRIHGEFLRLLYSLADRQASDYFTALGYAVVRLVLRLESAHLDGKAESWSVAFTFCQGPAARGGRLRTES